MKAVLKRSLFVFSLVFLSQPPLPADNSPKPAPRVIERTADDSELDSQIRLARQLIKHNDCHGVTAMLEPLFSSYPGHTVIYNLLRQCYGKLNYLPKSEDLTRRMIERHPTDYRYQRDLANTLVGQERTEEGLQSYRRALQLAGSDNELLSIANGMAAAGFADEALMLMDSLRGQIENSAAFSLQRGMLLEAQRLYHQAVWEYLPLLSDTAREASRAERRLLALLEYQVSSEQVEASLLEAVGGSSSSRAIKVLTEYYLKVGRLEEAHRYTLRLDSLEGLDGQALVRFMRKCSERRRFELAARMGGYFFGQYRESPVTAEAYFVYADALTQLGRYDAALAVYDSLVGWTPRVQDQAEGLYNIGMIYLDHRKEYRTARRYFDSVVTYYQRGIGFLRSHVARPYCDLRQGKMKAAAVGFGVLAKMNLHEDVAEEVDYHLAMIEYCQGHYDSAKVALQRLMVNYPRGFYVNDAMQLLLASDRMGEDTLLMAAYAEALRYDLRRLSDSLEAALTALVDGKSRVLGDIALYRLLDMSLDNADTARALGYVERLETEFPDSYYFPYGLKVKADLIHAEADRIDECRLLYRRLLEEFPDYPFATEVRERLRELEVDESIG